MASRAGKVVLVDRLWPRGMRKEELTYDLWLRDLAPSHELRHWFGHDPARWPEFQRRYREELRDPGKVTLLEELLEYARAGPLTLLFGARDQERNQAVVLAQVLLELSRRG